MLKHALMAVALLIPSMALAQASADDLAWLTGDWESGPEPWVEEHWSSGRGGILMGYSRNGRDGNARGFEFFRIAPGEDQVLVYHAQPGGRPAVQFRLVEATGTSATFENPAHDFPQRIRYERQGDTLTATLTKLDGSEPESYSYRRR